VKKYFYNWLSKELFSNPPTKILYQSAEKITPKDFGIPTKTMARGFASAEPTGGVSPIFQLGSSRMLQFKVRIKFKPFLLNRTSSIFLNF